MRVFVSDGIRIVYLRFHFGFRSKGFVTVRQSRSGDPTSRAMDSACRFFVAFFFS